MSGIKRALIMTIGTSTNAIIPKTAQIRPLRRAEVARLDLRIRYTIYKNNKIAALTGRGLGVHHIFQSAREKIEPVTFKIAAKIVPTSADAAARVSQPVFEVIR